MRRRPPLQWIQLPLRVACDAHLRQAGCSKTASVAALQRVSVALCRTSSKWLELHLFFVSRTLCIDQCVNISGVIVSWKPDNCSATLSHCSSRSVASSNTELRLAPWAAALANCLQQIVGCAAGTPASSALSSCTDCKFPTLPKGATGLVKMKAADDEFWLCCPFPEPAGRADAGNVMQCNLCSVIGVRERANVGVNTSNEQALEPGAKRRPKG